MEMRRQRDVVPRSQWSGTEFFKAEFGNPGTRCGDFNLAALDAQTVRGDARAFGQGGKHLGNARGCFLRRGRVQEDFGSGQIAHAIIGRACQFQHVELLLDHVNEGEKVLALQAILVQVIGHAV